MTDLPSDGSKKPLRPYLFGALYQWIIDNGWTPMIEADTRYPGVVVPAEYIKSDRIVLNIAIYATHNMHIDDDGIAFSARFNGVSQDLYVPMASLAAIICRDTGQVIPFDPSEYPLTPSQSAKSPQPETSAQPDFDVEIRKVAAKPGASRTPRLSVHDSGSQNASGSKGRSAASKTASTASTAKPKPKLTLLD